MSSLLYNHLTQGAVDLWIVSLPIKPTLLASLEHFLNTKESENLKSFRNKILRDNAVASRGSLRFILSKYLGKSPNLIAIDTNKYGKPYIPDSNLKFNVSHSGKYILVALSKDIDLGIDIEQVTNDFAYSDIVDNFFTEGEKSSIYAQSSASEMAFYRAWTRKEACLKAVGKGLSIDLQDIEVTCAANEPAKVIKFKNHDQDWQLLEIDIESQYIASLALRSVRPCYIKKINFEC